MNSFHCRKLNSFPCQTTISSFEHLTPYGLWFQKPCKPGQSICGFMCLKQWSFLYFNNIIHDMSPVSEFPMSGHCHNGLTFYKSWSKKICTHYSKTGKFEKLLSKLISTINAVREMHKAIIWKIRVSEWKTRLIWV